MNSDRTALLLMQMVMVTTTLVAGDAMAFRVDSLAVDLRVDLVEGTAFARSDHRLRLAATVPEGAVLLRCTAPGFLPASTDTGERVGWLVRSYYRTVWANADSPVNKEREVTIDGELCPPWKPCAKLTGPIGTLRVLLARGVASSVTVEGLSKQAGVVVAAFGSARALTIGERARGEVIIEVDAALAANLAPLSFVHAEGRSIVPRPREVSRDERAVRMAYEVGTNWDTLVATWYPEVVESDVPVRGDALAIPGGLPGIGGMVMPGEPPRAAVVAVVVAPKSALHLAVAQGDTTALARLLDAEAAAVAAALAASIVTAPAITAKPAAKPAATAVARAAVAKPLPLIERPEVDGLRPLHRAAVAGQVPALRQLLARGADREAFSVGGLTALHLAAAQGQAAALAALLESAADHTVAAQVPGAATNGWTALHFAAMSGDGECLRLLLAAGADATREAKDGRSAIEFARDTNRLRVLRRLLGNAD